MRRLIAVMACIPVLLTTGADQVYSQDAWNMELIGKGAIDGRLIAYLAHDGYLYVATRQEPDDPPPPTLGIFTVVDISDPEHPVRSEPVYEGDDIWGFLLVDNLLYMAKAYGGVVIYDVQDPSSPVELAAFDEDLGFGYTLKRSGDYIGSLHQRILKFIDISDRLNPQLVSSIDLVYYDTGDFEFFGDYVLLSDGIDMLQDYRLEIYDISDISNPVHVSTTSIGSIVIAVSLSVIGNYAYLYPTLTGVQIYDISDPMSPEYAGAILEGATIIDMEVTGTTAFASRHDDAILTMDVSDPASPIVTNEFDVQSVRGFGREILDLSGNELFFLAAREVISFADVSDPNSPQLLGRYLPRTYSWERPAKWGNYIYIGNSNTGLRILDVSDPTVPVGVNCYYSYGSIYYPLAYNGLLYFTGTDYGVMIFSLDDPLNPEYLSTAPIAGGARCVSVNDNSLYVVWGNVLSIFDISDPYNPVETGYYQSEDQTNGLFSVFAHGDFAYIGEQNYGLGVYDISDPGNPVKVGAYANSIPTTVFYKDDIVYATDSQQGLLVIDVSDPADPSLMGSLQIERPNDVFVDGQIAYVPDVDMNLKAIDVSDPYSPQLIGTFDDEGTPTGVYVENDTAYVSAHDSGLWILRYSGTTQEIPTLSEWGMIILALLLLASGTLTVIRRRKRAIRRTMV